MRLRIKTAVGIVALAFLLVGLVSSQATTAQPGALVFEFSHKGFSPGFGNFLSIETVRIYESGNCIRESEYPERSKSGEWRKVTTKEEKQLDAAELVQLIEWADQADFLNANSKYAGKTRIDSWEILAIVYRRKGVEKSIDVLNYYSPAVKDRPIVPEAFKKLAKWAFPYSFPE